ncbi:Peptidase family A1 domain [Phytophthora cactorum]|nr:Peptidase family A1 domain [Phytophthora cactorum]
MRWRGSQDVWISLSGGLPDKGDWPLHYPEGKWHHGPRPPSLDCHVLHAECRARDAKSLHFMLPGDGGELVFGGVDYSHHTSDVGYTPLLDDKSAYYPVHVKDIRMNGVSLGIDAGTINSGRGVIVDSGTTDTFFDSKGSRTFMKAFRNAAGREYSEKRMDLTNDELAALPTISIILSGMKGDGTDDVQLDIPASRYLTPSTMLDLTMAIFISRSQHSSVESNTTATALADAADTVDVTTSSSTGATSNRASPKFGAFIAEVILISLVGVALAVMVWTKWRTRSWSRIPDATETSRAHMETIVDIDESRSLSPTSPPGSPLSPDLEQLGKAHRRSLRLAHL